MYIQVLEIGQCVGFLEEAEIRKTLKDYHLCKCWVYLMRRQWKIIFCEVGMEV